MCMQHAVLHQNIKTYSCESLNQCIVPASGVGSQSECDSSNWICLKAGLGKLIGAAFWSDWRLHCNQQCKMLHCILKRLFSASQEFMNLTLLSELTEIHFSLVTNSVCLAYKPIHQKKNSVAAIYIYICMHFIVFLFLYTPLLIIIVNLIILYSLS